MVIAALLRAVPGGAQGFQRVILTSDASSPFGMTAGDFDGDGDVDAATTNFSNGQAIWFETRQDGPAVPHVLDVAYGRLRGIAAGDFDDDGDVDLAVAAYEQNKLLWLENRRVQGADTFLTHILRSQSPGAWAAVAGDVDQDGEMDLITTEFTGNVSRVFRQINGQLVETAAFSMHNPMDAVVVDFDGDGDRDVVVGNYSDNIVWLEQTAGGWTRHALTFGDSLACIGAADLDGDGDADLIVPPYVGSQSVQWWEQTPTGFTPHTLPGQMTQVRDIGTADFDEDGDPDIVASAQDGVLRWWENAGNGTFVQHNAEQGASLYNLTIIDYDQDGDLDVLVADHGGAQLLFYRNTMGVPSVVSGFVRAAAGGQPVADVMVRAIQTGVTTTSDTTGHYVLRCAAGIYDLTTRHPCWNDTLLTGVSAVSGETTAVDLFIVRPLVELETSSLNLVAQNGQQTTVPLTLVNRGDGVLAVTASATGNYPNDPWLSIAPESAVVAAGESFAFDVQIAPDTSYSQNWDYAGLIHLHTNACPDSEIQVAVVVYVLEAPESPDALPWEIVFKDIYPNPFNASATVRFDLPQAHQVRLGLFDITGRLTQTLANGTFDAGRHSLMMDGQDLASGVYLLVFEAGNVRLTRKVVLLK